MSDRLVSDVGSLKVYTDIITCCLILIHASSQLADNDIYHSAF